MKSEISLEQWRKARRDAERLSMAQLEALCFDFGIDFDGLGGRGKTGKIVEMLGYVKRRGRGAEFLPLLDTAVSQIDNQP